MVGNVVIIGLGIGWLISAAYSFMRFPRLAPVLVKKDSVEDNECVHYDTGKSTATVVLFVFEEICKCATLVFTFC